MSRSFSRTVSVVCHLFPESRQTFHNHLNVVFFQFKRTDVVPFLLATTTMCVSFTYRTRITLRSVKKPGNCASGFA